MWGYFSWFSFSTDSDGKDCLRLYFKKIFSCQCVCYSSAAVHQLRRSGWQIAGGFDLLKKGEKNNGIDVCIHTHIYLSVFLYIYISV